MVVTGGTPRLPQSLPILQPGRTSKLNVTSTVSRVFVDFRISMLLIVSDSVGFFRYGSFATAKNMEP